MDEVTIEKKKEITPPLSGKNDEKTGWLQGVE